MRFCFSYSFISQPAGQGSGPFSLGKLEKQNVGTVWLANHNLDGSLDKDIAVYTANSIILCWKPADGVSPDMEAIILYKDLSDNKYKTARNFYQATGAGGTSCDSSYTDQVSVSLPVGSSPNYNILLALRLKPVGDNAFVVVDPPDPQVLPSQGNEVISTGKAGDTVRKIRVVKSYPTWPEIFDYVLFSGGDLVKE